MSSPYHPGGVRVHLRWSLSRPAAWRCTTLSYFGISRLKRERKVTGTAGDWIWRHAVTASLFLRPSSKTFRGSTVSGDMCFSAQVSSIASSRPSLCSILLEVPQQVPCGLHTLPDNFLPLHAPRGKTTLIFLVYPDTGFVFANAM